MASSSFRLLAFDAGFASLCAAGVGVLAALAEPSACRGARLVVRKGDAFDLGSASPSSNSISNSSSSSSTAMRFDDGGVAGLGLEAGLGRDGERLAEPGHPQRNGPDGELVAGFKDLLSHDSLAIDKRSVRAAEVADGELVRDLEDLTMAPADLRRLDPDHAVIVSTDAGDAVGQLECGRGAAAADDLEYVIHRGGPLVRDAAGEMIDLHVSYRLAARYANGKRRSFFGPRPTVF